MAMSDYSFEFPAPTEPPMDLRWRWWHFTPPPDPRALIKIPIDDTEPTARRRQFPKWGQRGRKRLRRNRLEARARN